MSANGPRRPLFNRPAWAAKETAAVKDSSIFGRHRVFDEVLALEEKKRIKREAKAKAKARAEKEEEKSQSDEPQRKKRRISKEPTDEGSESDSASTNTAGSSRGDTGEKKTGEYEERVLRSTPKKDEKLRNGLEDSSSTRKTSMTPTQDSVVIELGDEDSKDEHSKTKSTVPAENPSKQKSVLRQSPHKPKDKSKSVPEPESEESEEDDYMRALKRKAREKSRRQRLGIGQDGVGVSASPASDERSPSIDHARPDSIVSPPSAPNDAADPFLSQNTSTEDDPEVGILIKSMIPNSKPLIVNRRASQPLQQVKDFWCARQGFEPSFSAKVFFTWRNIKLFNSSTMRTVLRQLRKEKGFDPDGNDDPSKGKITVEAMTQEIYDERQKAKERKMAAEANSDEYSEAENEQGAPEPVPEPPKKDGIVIKLTSQGLEAMPLRVRPHTSIDKIMRAFQHQREVDKEKTCWLVFDGERLAKERSVEDVGFEEGDEIEVYPR